MSAKHLLVILALLALLAPASPAHAGGVVTVCDEAHLLAALAGGGTVTFACSGTVTLTAEIVISSDTTIDASGQDVTISGNNTVRVFTVNEGVTLSLSELTVANGDADFAGGILNRGTLAVSNSTFSGNYAATMTAWPCCGGGIYNEGMLTVGSSTFSDNSAPYGGGIYNNSGMVTVIDSTFTGNSAVGGGGIFNRLGTVTIGNSAFTKNRGDYPGSGGAIATQGGNVFASNVAFSSNIAVGGVGGAIQNEQSTVIINGSTFSGNISTGDGFGGAISNSVVFGGVLVVSNSTFFENRARFGGAIFNASQLTTVGVINSTFSGNRTDGDGGEGGGIANGVGSHMVLRNTIVASSPTGGNCSGAIIDGGGNLSYPDATCPGINRNPELGPLRNNGGPTKTMALGPGSAAIDAADDAICAADPVNNLDQRGVTRPQGLHCDIGAYERQVFGMWFPLISAQ